MWSFCFLCRWPQSKYVFQLNTWEMLCSTDFAKYRKANSGLVMNQAPQFSRPHGMQGFYWSGKKPVARIVWEVMYLGTEAAATGFALYRGSTCAQGQTCKCCLLKAFVGRSPLMRRRRSPFHPGVVWETLAGCYRMHASLHFHPTCDWSCMPWAANGASKHPASWLSIFGPFPTLWLLSTPLISMPQDRAKAPAGMFIIVCTCSRSSLVCFSGNKKKVWCEHV